MSEGLDYSIDAIGVYCSTRSGAQKVRVVMR